MNQDDIIYHYTSINTLALILKHKNIRFNRLDRVDDISEAKAYGKYDLAKYLFVSCWTDLEKESIPQWHMYTNEMTGVRISLPKKCFHQRELQHKPEWGVVSKTLSPIPLNRIYTDEYIVLTSFLKKDQFQRKIQYVPNIDEVYREAVKLNESADGSRVDLRIDEIGKLASFKNEDWKFQHEFRFVLFIIPSIPIPERGPSDEVFLENLTRNFFECIKNGKAPPIISFDVDLDPDVLDNVVVTLGPLCSEGDEVIVQALLDRFTNNGRLQKSSLAGKIRKPRS